jgi:hypothetical protein
MRCYSPLKEMSSRDLSEVKNARGGSDFTSMVGIPDNLSIDNLHVPKCLHPPNDVSIETYKKMVFF